jgi:hypothetical protein
MSTPSKPEPAPHGESPLSWRDCRVNPIDRRALTWRTLLASGLAPRRRGGRRAGEQELLVDFHEPYLLLLAVVMLLLSVADAFLTVTLMTHGAVEANPLLALVLNEHPRAFAAVKMALTGAGVVLLVVIARARLFELVSGRTFLQGLVAVYGALVAYEAWLVSTKF